MAQRINAFLAPSVAACGPHPPVSLVPELRDAQGALQGAGLKRRKEDLAVEEGVNEVLAWAKGHRPKNTSRAYQPKQSEWRAWCQTIDFRPGGEYLPFNWVDEGKLLLFVKTQVAERAPRTGSRAAAEKKRKLEKAEAEDSTRKKRRRQEAGTMASALDGGKEEEESKPEFLLKYNSIRGYVSAIMELWNHQVSEKPHSSLSPHNVAVKALKTSIARGPASTPPR